jgi:hypothetical protein
LQCGEWEEKRRSESHIRGRKLVVGEKKVWEEKGEDYRVYRWRAGKERERKLGSSTEVKKGQEINVGMKVEGEV